MFFQGTAKKWLNNPCHKDLGNTYPNFHPRSLPKACYIWLVAFKSNQSSLDGCVEKGIIVLSRATEPRKLNIVSISSACGSNFYESLLGIETTKVFGSTEEGIEFQFLRIPIRD